MERVAVLIDGEHYIPVTESGIQAVNALKDRKVVVGVFIGGTEKIGTPRDVKKALPIPVILGSGSPPIEDIVRAVKVYDVDVVVDLSDEPVIDYKKRMLIASVLVAEGVRYEAADFVFKPIQFHDVLRRPSIKVIGLGKRVGKTALSSYTAKILRDIGLKPCIAKAARGGPEEPTVMRGDLTELTPEFLLSEADKGKHAASDYYEEALLSRVITIGARRCGGGMVGQPYYTSILDAAKKANTLPCSFVIIEGSGTTVPPIFTEECMTIVGVNQPIRKLTECFGPYKLRISDLIILTMCEEQVKDKAKKFEKIARKVNPTAKVVLTVLRPKPVHSIEGKRCMFCTVAPPNIAKSILVPYLEEHYGCEITGFSSHLSNRPKLRNDLTEHLGDADVLLTEIKAAAVDVATRIAFKSGKETIFVDNIPVSVGGDHRDPADAIRDLSKAAAKKYEQRSEKEA